MFALKENQTNGIHAPAMKWSNVGEGFVWKPKSNWAVGSVGED